MCGRYSVVIDEAKLRKQFSKDLVTPPGGLPTNYNMAPTQNGLVITDRDPGQLSAFRWGLVPFWAKDLKIGARMINARREGIEEKSSFRKPIREQRCLVIGDSFYEWKREGGNKTPFRILPETGELLVMAGIWESWKPKDGGETVYTYSIITGEPNAEMAPIHDRMPMLLTTGEQQSGWLDRDAELSDILGLLATPVDGTLTTYAVSQEVGNVRNNGPQLHEPAA
ncbi:putative SOS response-associated peptidase YedK [Neolewinella xylanilytica]|uniref:Abasic site processing protein n=1 Tax=Neolewinella xylanilytica TaxID=1514080 RepID=A0A2S6I0X9_9BACT|nr:SOS response-associated peptidase [Neolewinella xylanilytica]PPK84629.1 putative SOS response-associated peptidase YedK [Neolewinella xylanilytica]